MKVRAVAGERSFVYRLELDRDDRPENKREYKDCPTPFRLVNREYQVNLPASFRSIHPDAHALAIWFALRPVVGSRLELSFSVSPELAEGMLSEYGVTLTRVSKRQKPRRAPEAAVPALLFSGGMDSMAASLVMPKKSHHLFLDRIPHGGHDQKLYMTDLAPQRAACAAVRKAGNPVHATADDHEHLFEPYPIWHSNMPLLTPLYMADSLGLGVIDEGEIFDPVFGGYHPGGATSWRMNSQTGPDDDKSPSRFYEQVGLRRVGCVSGLSEVATTKIVALSPYRGKSYSCYYPSKESFCLRCDKCFKKLLLRHIAEGQEVPEALFEQFLSNPALAAIFARPYFDWHHVWYYLFQNIQCRHWFAVELKRQASAGPDLSCLEKWYPKAVSNMASGYLEIVRANIGRYVETMSEAEVRHIESVDVPPLQAPPLKGAAPAPRAAVPPPVAPPPPEAPAVQAQAPVAASKAPPSGLGRLLAGVDRELRASVKCRSRFEGDLVLVSLGDKEFGLYLAPRDTYKGLSFAELPSFFVCIRGEAKMTQDDDSKLKAYLKALALRDAELKELLRS